MRYLSFILLFILTLQSCFEEEEMVPLHEQGDLLVGQAALEGEAGDRKILVIEIRDEDIVVP